MLSKGGGVDLNSSICVELGQETVALAEGDAEFFHGGAR